MKVYESSRMQEALDGPVDSHTKIILERYADRGNIGIIHSPPDMIVERYLSKAMWPAEFNGKTIIEIGAGCSQYIPVFLSYGCKTYYANDLIPERLAATRPDDPRYVELPGDFRKIEVPEQVDIVFACLTMMFIMPMLDQFMGKIRDTLKPGGVFVSMDPNYFCPLSVYRRFADLKPNPAKLFSPLRYANAFRESGFELEKLVPFTTSFPWTTGSWLMGTNFWLKARRL